MVTKTRKPNYVALMAGVGLVMGPELYKIQDWSQVWTPQFIGTVIFQGAGIVIAWMANGMSVKAFVSMRRAPQELPTPPKAGE